MSRRSDRALAFAPLTVLTVLAIAVAGLSLRDSGSNARQDSEGHRGVPASVTPTPTVSAQPEPTEEPQPVVSLKQARKQWDDAMVDSVLEGTGRYEWSVTAFGRTMIQEEGVFGFDPLRTSYSRTMTVPDPEPGQPSEFVINMVRSDKDTYMQMGDWGPWDGCWLRIAPDMAGEGELSGLQAEMLRELSDTPEIPGAIIVPLNSTVSSTRADHFPAPYVEYTAQVSLLEALSFVGVNNRILFPKREALLKGKAPITVAIGVDDRPYAAFADGRAISGALRRSGVVLADQIYSFLDLVSAEVRFTDLGVDVDVQVPDQDVLLPPGATRADTCRGKE